MRTQLTLLALLGAAPAIAEENKLEHIVIEGNERVERATVMSYLPFRQGGEYNPGQSSELIRALYATGLFSNVEVSWGDGTLKIQVEENPLVNKVAFEGNENLDDDIIKPLLNIRSRSVYTPAKVRSDVEEILALYRSRGRFLAKVDPQIIKRDQNRVDVIYAIDEGEKTEIESIRFVGNKRFSDADLQDVILTRESAWWRFLSSNDVYEPARIEVDKQMLRRHYIKHGYADFQVVSAVTELSREKDAFYITFTVSEGPLYEFGQVGINLADTREGLKKENLRDVLSVEEGMRYDGELVESNIDNLVDYLGAKGFAFLDVVPRFERNEAEKKVDVTFDIRPGPRVYVNRIEIKGNTRTKDEVIRREMRLAEGDAFSTNKLKRSRDRVNYLGFFESVEVEKKETNQPDKVDLEVEVKEQSTGEFTVGAGFSTFEGVLATADVRERNLLGRGQDLLLSFSLSSVRQNFDFSFTEPYFMDHEVAAGVDLFNRRVDLQTEASHDRGDTGGALRLGFPLGEYSRNGVRLAFSETKIDNVDTDASQFVRRDEGKRSALEIENTFVYDTRDSATTPTDGYRYSASLGYTGFGSSVNMLRGQLSGSWHTQVAEGYVFSVGGRAGAIADLAGDLPLYEHFSGGGANLRGFDRAGIGPRDIATNDSLGGKYMIGNNVELTFPIPGLDDVGVNGVIFTDGGIVTEFEDSTAVADTHIYRLSAGTGIYWRSPMGPLRFEFGFPLVKAEEDQTQIFSFSFGTRF